MCKFESGLTSKKCKLFLGRVSWGSQSTIAHLQITQTDPRPKFAKELFFFPRSMLGLKIFCIFDKFVKKNNSIRKWKNLDCISGH